MEIQFWSDNNSNELKKKKMYSFTGQDSPGSIPRFPQLNNFCFSGQPTNLTPFPIISISVQVLLREAFHTKKQGNLGNGPKLIWGQIA